MVTRMQNPYTSKFLKWTLSSSICSELLFEIRGSVKNQNRMTYFVDPDETSHYEPSLTSHYGLNPLTNSGIKVGNSL